MWKAFKYSGRERVAFVPAEGPSFQVLDTGKPSVGFRAFKPEKMSEVRSAVNLFSMIPKEILEEYPELEVANE